MKPADENQQVATQISDVEQLRQLREKMDASTEQFRILSAALLPLREQSMALEHTRGNLTEWKASIVAQGDRILRTLLARAIGLLAVLFILFMISEGWKRATFKYVHDARRRRQFLLVRRFATTAIMAVVLVMGFVSDFSSLATFAGFITAGIAVALQTVILSVAAYFFLIGRYGVRVGDRVTVSGVTGDVIDIGLVRVFLMELAGTGVDLFPTGRVVVLANSALFSSSPVYKQLPGTDYAWHEIYISMSADLDPTKAQKALLDAVNKVYGGYRQSIERQHGALEKLLDYKTDLPVPTTHVRLTDSGFEIVVRFPTEIRKMSETDEAVAIEVMATIHADEDLKKTMTSMPRIRSAVKN
jgi:small-conductance mechanosensitive channel